MNEQIKKIDSLIKKINSSLLELYKKDTSKLVDFVNNKFYENKSLSVLIGNNPISLMEQNHINHADFIQKALILKDASNIFDTFVWAYRTYYFKGFTFNYFSLELTFWIEALKSTNFKLYEPLIEFYSYMLSLHEYIISCAISFEDTLPEIINNELYNSFLNSLLKPNISEALKIADEFIKTQEDVQPFWEQIILPSLYSIGNRWAKGEISVGEEHTATSICQRVMSEHYDKILAQLGNNKKILILNSPNELHEVGARMISDILEIYQYNVFFLGSKANIERIIKKTEDEDIEHILISTTMVSNIENTRQLILELRSHFTEKPKTIYVGGQAYTSSPKAIEVVKADHYVKTTNQLLRLLEQKQ